MIEALAAWSEGASVYPPGFSRGDIMGYSGMLVNIRIALYREPRFLRTGFLRGECAPLTV
jgi:hypothetical protein